MEVSNDQWENRISKLNELRKLGIKPYPSKSDKEVSSSYLVSNFSELEKKDKIIKYAGRIMTIRGHGGSTFMHLQDEKGRFQVYIKKDVIGDDKYSIIKKYLDLGDFISVSGKLFTTKKGEPSIMVDDFELLAKSLNPLPEKWHGLKDTDLRFRNRHLDMIMNPEMIKIFRTRSKIIDTLRSQLNNWDYLEVETPTLQPIYGGTLAKPFKTKFNAVNREVYLRISNELYLKRLIAGGLEKIYEFSVDFRNEGIDTTHNPEFLQLETMTAYNDYEDSMKLLEELLYQMVLTINQSPNITYQNKKISFKKPWNKISFPNELKKITGVDFTKSLNNFELLQGLNKKGIKIEKSAQNNKGKIAEKILDELIAPNIVNPTIVYDYPIETSPLAKEKDGLPGWVERFEFFIAGKEIGNVYSELNDPIALRNNLIQQQEQYKQGDKESHPADEDFIKTMASGMPPTSGIGIGIDRLVMILTNQTSIREVNFFPMLKEK
ncbi:lysine--tRNA ligase [Patescibacteria group bacterium]